MQVCRKRSFYKIIHNSCEFENLNHVDITAVYFGWVSATEKKVTRIQYTCTASTSCTSLLCSFKLTVLNTATYTRNMNSKFMNSTKYIKPVQVGI